MTDEEIEVIIKPIFTKMFKANFSACEYGIECYKKGMEYQGIKELAIENDNLIKRIAKFEEEQRKNNGFSDNLTKAKGLLLRFVELKKKPCAVGHSVNMLLYENACEEVEQFLKEIEK